MDALVMCGGEGTRLDAAVEKPLFQVAGRPMVDHVLDALRESAVESIHAVGSPATPETLAYVACATVEAPGEGYVADLQYAVECVDPPVLTVAADLPLLEASIVDRVVERSDGHSLAVYVPAERKRALGVSVGETTVDETRDRVLAPTGVNVVGPGSTEARLVTDDARLAVNVNRPSDARVAEALG